MVTVITTVNRCFLIGEYGAENVVAESTFDGIAVEIRIVNSTNLVDDRPLPLVRGVKRGLL